jgi:hypothetical protein
MWHVAARDVTLDFGFCPQLVSRLKPSPLDVILIHKKYHALSDLESVRYGRRSTGYEYIIIRPSLHKGWKCSCQMGVGCLCINTPKEFCLIRDPMWIPKTSITGCHWYTAWPLLRRIRMQLPTIHMSVEPLPCQLMCLVVYVVVGVRVRARF